MKDCCNVLIWYAKKPAPKNKDISSPFQVAISAWSFTKRSNGEHNTYLNIVADQVYPFMATEFSNDSGLCTLRHSKLFRNGEEHDKEVNVLMRSTNSPDLNSIKHLLKEKVLSMQVPCHNLQDLNKVGNLQPYHQN